MFSYFKELLTTLKSIDESLKAIRAHSEHTSNDIAKLSSCVVVANRSYGDRISISTRHWNE